MMLKVLIVDDDVFSRTDLKTMIDWEKAGFYISGEASSVPIAIQSIEQDVPDIVITDMHLPCMSGVDLIDHINNNWPQIRVIALSAYDDFDYVRQSMKKGAVDYVLKHLLNSKVLLDILETARQAVMEYRNEYSQKVLMTEQLSNRKSVLCKEFIQRLIMEDSPDINEIENSISTLGISLDKRNLVVAIAEIDDYAFIEEKYPPKEIDLLIRTFLEMTKEILNDWKKSVIVHLSKGRFVIIFSLGDVYSMLFIYNSLFTVIDRIRSGIKKYLNVSACFSVSKVCHDILKISQAYKEADLMLEDKLYKGKNSIFMEDAVKKSKDGFMCLDIKDERDLIYALRGLDYDKVKQLIDGIFDRILNNRMGSKSTQMICAELINIVNKVVKETGLEISQIYTNEDIPYNMMQKYETIIDIKEWIMGLYGKLISILTKIRIADKYSEITRKVIEYVNKNYKKDISLGEISEFSGVSSSYLSRIFKEDCGIGFVEYLNRIRVENAKNLIENGDYRFKEIVAKVGFNNYNYFFKVFKEFVGMTPLEYEQGCRK
jgi:two-component system response regulator YesN